MLHIKTRLSDEPRTMTSRGPALCAVRGCIVEIGVVVMEYVRGETGIAL